MPVCTDPKVKARSSPGTAWIVEGALLGALWRTDWVLLHVAISPEEADAIEDAVQAVTLEAFPGAAGEPVESPIAVFEGKLCLKAWGRQVGTIRNRDDEELVSVRAGAKVALRVRLSPYRDPARGLRVTAFPMRLDVRKAAPKPRPIKGKKTLAAERARNVLERAAAKAKAPTPPKPPKAPRVKPTPATVIPFPLTTTKH